MNNPFPRMHVSFYVSNLQNTIDFYNRFFRQTPTKVRSKYAKYILDAPSLIISFIENKDRIQPHFGHLGFQVETPEQLLERRALAEAEDLVAKEEMGTSCCYARQDKFWVNDPDGVQWEVYYFHHDTEFNDPHYESTDASACCTVSSEGAKSACGCNANVAAGEEVACC